MLKAAREVECGRGREMECLYLGKEKSRKSVVDLRLG
jgi:hypothetical protein